MNVRLTDGRREAYQWDAAIFVTIDVEADELHWYNGNEILAVEKTTSGYFPVPNKLLKTSCILRCFAYTPTNTRAEGRLVVRPREKPPGYVYTETEVKTWDQITSLTRPYELIESITITESMLSFQRIAEPDGTPYSFRSLLLVLFSPGANGSHGSSLRFYSTADGQYAQRYALSLSFSTNNMNRTVGIGELLQPGLQMPFTTSSTTAATSTGTLSMGNNAALSRPITKVELINPTVPAIGVLTAGDTITIYGIRW